MTTRVELAHRQRRQNRRVVSVEGNDDLPRLTNLSSPQEITASGVSLEGGQPRPVGLSYSRGAGINDDDLLDGDIVVTQRIDRASTFRAIPNDDGVIPHTLPPSTIEQAASPLIGQHLKGGTN